MNSYAIIAIVVVILIVIIAAIGFISIPFLKKSEGIRGKESKVDAFNRAMSAQLYGLV